MRTTIFKQYAGKWANQAFPAGDTVKGSGCGLCSVTHILIETEQYKDYTPSDVRPYMVKWAVKGEGLIHAGIPDTLRHYGMKNVKEFGRTATMKEIFTECNKGKRKGVILFVKVNSRGDLIPSVGPDGTCWTGGGHFIAFTDYKVKDGKHYFYMKDSGSRDHDGWYCYDTSMKGCVWKVWTCTLPKEEKKAYTGKLPEVHKAEKTHYAKDINRLALEYAYGYKETKKYPAAKAKSSYLAAIKDVWGSKLSKQMAAGANCVVFVSTVLKKSGLRKLGTDKVPSGKTAAGILAKSDEYKKVSGTDTSKMKAGTVGAWTKKNGSGHVLIVVEKDGVKYIAEASHPKKILPRLSKKAPKYTASKYKSLAFYEPKEKTLRPSNYLKQGSTGDRVKMWQAFLKWYGYDISTDGDFGPITLKATNDFQKANGLKVTGQVGVNTIAKAREVRK